MSEKESGVLLDEQVALESYLNALLQEATEGPEVDEPEIDVEFEAPADSAPAPAQVAAPAPAPAPAVSAEVAPAPAPEAPVLTDKVEPVIAQAPAVAEARVETQAPVSLPSLIEAPEQSIPQDKALVPTSTETAPERPAWAGEQFQVVLFDVGGLTLALPLAELTGIQPWSDDISPMPGHSPWFLGLIQVRDHHTKVVDPYPLVVPQNRRVEAHTPANGRIVLIDDNRWGLACNSVSKVLTLSPEDVQWRSSRTKRPWLLGTVIKHMCAVLDVQAFAKMLETGSRD